MLEDPIKKHLVALYEPQGMIEPELLKGGTTRIRECLDCGALYHDEVPDDFLMDRLYEHWIDPKLALEAHRAHVTVDTRMMFIREIVLAINHLARGKALRALDFGMGWGDWCLMARAFGCDVVGSERSPSRSAHAQDSGTKTIDWDEISTQTFDLINCDQVLEHVVAPVDILKHLASALAPGGLLKVSVPDGADVRGRLKRGDWMATEGSADSLLSITPLQHINCFDHRSLLNMASRAGLEPAKIPLCVELGAAVDRMAPKTLLAGLTRPFGRKLFTRDTYVFLQRSA